MPEAMSPCFHTAGTPQNSVSCLPTDIISGSRSMQVNSPQSAARYAACVAAPVPAPISSTVRNSPPRGRHSRASCRRSRGSARIFPPPPLRACQYFLQIAAARPRRAALPETPYVSSLKIVIAYLLGSKRALEGLTLNVRVKSVLEILAPAADDLELLADTAVAVCVDKLH